MAVRDRGRASRQYAKALEADPENRVARLLAGRLDREIELGLAAAAANTPRQDLTPVGGLPEVERHMTRGEFDEAIAILETEIERRPDDAELLGRLGECYIRVDRPADAREVVERAAALDDENPGYPFLLGLIYEKLGRVDEARAAYERAVERNEWDFKARTNLGQIYLAAGETERAREQFLAAHEIVPGKPFPLYNVATTWAAEGKWEETRRACEDALVRRETFAPAHVLLGDARAALGDGEGARESWRRALALRPGDPEIQRRLSSP
jgi:Flp pilus assembly protein TadD